MKVGGREFDLTKQEVEARMKNEEPELIQKHMVEVNGQIFPPKQVLGHVTGWARTSFTTMEAQRVLTRLGFECEATGGAISRAGQLAAELVGGAAHDATRQMASDQREMGSRQGFTAAARIALLQIQGQLDAMREQMKEGGLGQTEQAVYARLDEIKAEIEAGYDRYWQGTGVDWRPLKPIAKGAVRVVRRADASSPPG